MKSKALLTAVLLATTNLASANGGLSVGNVEQHMNTDKWIAAETASQKIIPQSPIDQFKVTALSRDRSLVDTDQLRQTYDGRT
jgi:hypothetical protein